MEIKIAAACSKMRDEPGAAFRTLATLGCCENEGNINFSVSISLECLQANLGFPLLLICYHTIYE